MPKLLKHLAATLLYYSGAITLVNWLKMRIGRDSHVTVLMYHRVLDDPASPHEYAQTGTAVSIRAFAKQIEFLKKRFTVISAGDYINRLRNGKPLPRACVVITFDDGWRDNYLNAYPILRRYNIPATIFVCSDFVGTTNKFWFHELLHAAITRNLAAAELQTALNSIAGRPEGEFRIPDSLEGIYLYDCFLKLVKTLQADEIDKLVEALCDKEDVTWSKQRFLLTWEEIAAMDSQIIEIGSHGRSHRLLTAISLAEAYDELRESKRVIEEKTGRTVSVLAYPNGSYEESTMKAAGDAGYLGAFAVNAEQNTNDLFAVPRVGIHEGACAGLGGKFSLAKFALLISRSQRPVAANLIKPGEQASKVGSA